MRENKAAAWIALVLFTAAFAIMVLLSFTSRLPASLTRDVNPDLVLLVVAALALLAAVLGFLAFKAIPAKIASVGGAILFLVAAGMYAVKLG
jgi:UDP-N-acetylmuramyl pentapeptide phosphotransferase/UDP-N-acetylglucosamine-1-phosphate transferase